MQWDSSATACGPFKLNLGFACFRRITPMFAENPIRLAQGTWRSPHELRIN